MLNNINIPTPSHIFDLDQLKLNINRLSILSKETSSKVLYAIKACSQQEILSIISKHLCGACASGLNEALIADKTGFKEIHTFSTAYKEQEIISIAQKSDVVIFNSLSQYEKYSNIVRAENSTPGIRMNPNYSEIKNDRINPCVPNSRFGVQIADLEKMSHFPEYLHFHTMCEQYSDTLERTLAKLTQNYGPFIKQAKYINIGGGQLYTDREYNLLNAIQCINSFKEQNDVSIILEPGEAVLRNVGYLVGSVIDIKYGQKSTAILDLSAICHIPDIVFSGYKYEIVGCSAPNVKKHTYILAGPTCYAGDIFGEFSFDEPLSVGSKIIICDTAHYTSVKSSMFNGISLPSIVLYSKETSMQMKRTYGFDEYVSIT